jgi:hypothetical protein
MTHSDRLLVLAMSLEFAFLLLPGIAWLVDQGVRHLVHRTKLPVAWSGARLRPHPSRFHTYRKSGRHDVKHA